MKANKSNTIMMIIVNAMRHKLGLKAMYTVSRLSGNVNKISSTGGPFDYGMEEVIFSGHWESDEE